MPLAMVESPRLYRQIADQLRHLIDQQEYPVGSRLPSERELAEKLGVSRPSVREALIALEVEGFVRIKMGSGVYVLRRDDEPEAREATRQPIEEGSFEVLKARALIESTVAAEAATLASAVDIAALEAIVARAEGGDLGQEGYLVLDRAFHVTLAGILHNAVIARLVGEMFDLRMNPYFRRLAAHFETADSWRQAAAEHRAVCGALARGDPEAARAAMREHLEASHARFSHSFGEGPAETAAAGAGIRAHATTTT